MEYIEKIIELKIKCTVEMCYLDWYDFLAMPFEMQILRSDE